VLDPPPSLHRIGWLTTGSRTTAPDVVAVTTPRASAGMGRIGWFCCGPAQHRESLGQMPAWYCSDFFLFQKSLFDLKSQKFI
jgi:hypothetical protein